MRLLEGAVAVDDVDAFVAEIGEISAATGATIQAFDARYVVSERHLERAVELADRAFERGENVARRRAVEILLYAAGRRQIDRALEMGVSEGVGPVVAVAAGGDEAAAAAAVADLLDPADALSRTDDARVRDFFDIGDAEWRATEAGLSALVRERVALLDVEK